MERNANTLPPPPVPNQIRNTGHLPEEQSNGVTAAFEQFQRQEQAQFGRPRNQHAGSDAAAPVASYGQPTPARQPPFTAYERHALDRYRPAGRNGRTSNLRNEVLNNEEVQASYSAFRNQGSSNNVIPRGTGGYRSVDVYQQPRQQPRWDQDGEYQGAYGDRNTVQASSTTAFKRSPYLLPGQEPHDVNNPPPAFQSRFPAPQGVHTTPSARHGHPATENAMNVRPQYSSILTGAFQSRSPAPQGIHTTPSTHQGYPATEHTVKARPQSSRTGTVNNLLHVEDAAEESDEEPKKQINKKKKGPPTHRPATLKKMFLKQGETKVENGQLMWSDPNEPEADKWSKPASMRDKRVHCSNATQSGPW